MLLALCSLDTNKIFVEILLRQRFAMESAEKHLSHVALSHVLVTQTHRINSTQGIFQGNHGWTLRGDVFPCAEQNCC